MRRLLYSILCDGLLVTNTNSLTVHTGFLQRLCEEMFSIQRSNEERRILGLRFYGIPKLGTYGEVFIRQ